MGNSLNVCDSYIRGKIENENEPTAMSEAIDQ